MAVPRKGWRKISVEGRAYHWRANGQDWGIDVVVVTEDAFHRGDRAQQLAFTLDYDHLRTPREDGGVGLRQRAAVSPEIWNRGLATPFQTIPTACPATG